MSDVMVKVHDVQTGEIVEREMNAQELAQYDKEQAEAQASAIKQAEAKAAKEAALAKLAALGLDLEDLKSLGF